HSTLLQINDIARILIADARDSVLIDDSGNRVTQSLDKAMMSIGQAHKSLEKSKNAVTRMRQDLAVQYGEPPVREALDELSVAFHARLDLEGKIVDRLRQIAEYLRNGMSLSSAWVKVRPDLLIDRRSEAARAVNLAASRLQQEVHTADRLRQRAAEVARTEALILRDSDKYLDNRPRRRFFGATAREYRFARYIEHFVRKLEDAGVTNFPRDPEGNALYGNLVMTVSIRADGTVEKAEVNRSSGDAALDEMALSLVDLAGPFEPFSEDIRKDTDILSITRTWTFRKDATAAR
ncbi:MAG: TonB family protein, partial [Burkholderiales bacterium]|nr:TonB family protein [Burkholderiales bacterium]